MGWALSARNDSKLALAALGDALRRRRPGKGLLHHTDRGSPYASEAYQDALANVGATCSMSRSGNCLDNAAMESWFATLKKELGEEFPSMAEAKRLLFRYIEIEYNRQRLHSKNGYCSPADYEAQHHASRRSTPSPQVIPAL